MKTNFAEITVLQDKINQQSLHYESERALLYLCTE